MGQENIVLEYLDLMDTQRITAFKALESLTEAAIWQQPAQGEWSIGEILDHTRALNASFLPLLQIVWFFGRGLAMRLRHKPYVTQIDDVYRRPGFPMKVGWLWSPRHTPKRQAPLHKIEQSLAGVHARYRAFYTPKEPDLLGHIHVYDPVMGRLNLIEVLRVGIYHDQLHFEDVLALAAELKRHTTPVA
jgi:hypothetical protein